MKLSTGVLLSKSIVIPNVEYGTPILTLITCFVYDVPPPVASEWKTRRRNYQFPDPLTIDMVIKNGCHIVPVAHIDCLGDSYQWRISFSTAEIILMKTLTRNQQLIYHLLRYFAKKN